MADLPEMTFGHIGLNVTEMDPMVAFYTGVMGFTLTDRGRGTRGGELTFLSRDPEEHHQIRKWHGGQAHDVMFCLNDSCDNAPTSRPEAWISLAN